VQKPSETPPTIQQRSAGPNSPNIVTTGPGSSVVFNAAPVPWALNEAQFDALRTALAPYARAQVEGAKDIIMAVGMSDETMKVTHQFVDAFRAAGWRLPGNGFGMGFGGPPLLGIAAIVHSADSVPPEIRVIAAALQKTQFLHGPLTVVTDDKLAMGEFGLQIGSRPD